MKIAVIGATGKAGALVAKEAADRGHEVAAIARDPSKLTDKRYAILQRDLFDLTADDVKGYDAIVSAFGTGFDPESAKAHVKAGEHLISVFEKARDVRLLVVGGAASLYTDPKRKRRVLDDIPDEWRPVPENQAKVLDALKASGIKWTFFSPAGVFDANGGRTGDYIPGTDFALKNADGENYISYADYAVAMIDAIESGEHVRERFTAVSDRKPKDKDAYYGIEKKKPQFEGISRYKPQLNFELAGKRFHMLMDFGRDIDVDFVSGSRLVWKQGDDPAYDASYECAKGAALCYFVNFEPKQMKPRTGITLIADLQTNLVTVCRSKTRFHQRHPTLVQTSFDFGAIETDGALPGKKRHCYTADLVGKRIHWKYSPDWSIIHVYYHPHYMRGTFTPDMIARMEQTPEQREGWEGNPYDERTHYIKIRDGLYLVECSEHSMARRGVPGNSLLFLMDTRRVHDVGRSFGHTGQFGGEGYLPENYLFGAFGEFVESDGTVERNPPFYQAD
jgi:putative NADH-flavin reductase